MSTSKIGVFANLALAASAVLLPPTMTAEDLGDDRAMEGLIVDPLKRVVTLQCPGCPFATVDGDSLKWTPNAGNAFALDLAVSDEYNLQVDDVQLFPPTMSLNTIHVTQVDPTSEEALRLRVTGFQLRFDGADTVSDAGTELLPLALQIATIEDVAVDLPELRINLLKDSEGRLMIASFDATEPTEVAYADEPKECNEWPLFCKWKNILADRIGKMTQMGKGCHKRPHGQGHDYGNVMEDETTWGKPPHRFRPGKPHHRPDGPPPPHHGPGGPPPHHGPGGPPPHYPNGPPPHNRTGSHPPHHGPDGPPPHNRTGGHPPHGPDGPPPHHGPGGPPPHHGKHGPPPHHGGPGGHHRHHHHHHHGHSRMQAFLRRAFFTVLIPIVIGVFVGTVTYLIGMALGCLIAMVIAKVRGQSYSRIALVEDDEESEVFDVKEKYTDLPAYEAPPIYDEAAEKEVVVVEEKVDTETK